MYLFFDSGSQSVVHVLLVVPGLPLGEWAGGSDSHLSGGVTKLYIYSIP